MSKRTAKNICHWLLPGGNTLLFKGTSSRNPTIKAIKKRT